MQTQIKTMEVTVSKTLETLAAIHPQQTTPQPFDEIKRRRWLDKWLKLKQVSHQILPLETAVFDFCRDYSKNPSRGRRLLVHGPNGTGKSHTAKAIYRWACRVAIDLPWVSGDSGPRLPKAELLNWPMFVKSIYRNFERPDIVEEPELLILDDVGAEHDPHKFAASELYLAVERREYRWTVITTNVEPQHWSERFDERVSSRFLRNFTHVSLSGVEDYNNSKLL